MSRASIIAIVIFLALTALVFSIRLNVAQRFQAVALNVVKPIHETTNGAVRRVGAFNKGMLRLEDLEHENDDLTRQNKELRLRDQILRGLEDENSKLRAALNYTQRAPFKLLPARIIARKSATWWNSVQINRGEQDGLDSDLPVVTDSGLVGKTTTVASGSAFVLLVTDENCRVAATIEGSREQGIISGERVTSTVQPELNLNFLSKTANLRPGQQVWSSGIAGGVFPANVLLGTVREFQPHELSGSAKVTPAVDLSKLENVFIVMGKREKGK